MRRFASLLVGVVAVSSTSMVYAGEITFKNGDHVTGTVTVADEDKLSLDSKVFGKITVPLSDVASFTTDGPIKATLTNGTVVKAPVTTVANGEATTQPAANESIPRDEIAKVQPATLAKPWTGDVLVGASVQTGNTNNVQINGSADAVRRWEDARLSLNAQYIYGRSKDHNTGVKTTSSDYGEADIKYDYFFTKKFYAYGLAAGQHDELANLVIRLTPSAGVGYQWHESPVWNFNTEAGVGWTYEDYSPGGVDEYVSGRLAYHYDRKITNNLAFVNDFEYLPSLQDVNNFVINADAGIRADISKTMFTEFKVQWTHDSKPAPGSLQNDLRYLASLGWHF